MKAPRVLIVDDDVLFCRSIVDDLGSLGIAASFATSRREALESSLDRFSVVVVDKHLPDGEGLSLMDAARKGPLGPRFVVVTGDPSVEHVVAAMRGEAVDYLSKPIELAALRASIHRALGAVPAGRRSAVRDELEAILPHTHAIVRRYAQAELSVVIGGETGTGKTRLARAIHDASPRVTNPFIALNCAALAESVIEAELFGSTRGAFTGATERAGLIELADRGTLFLDEIGELPLSAQAKLLEVVEQGRVRRVGGGHWRTVDVRIVAATHVDLAKAVRTSRFREDLLFRLDVGSLRLPPLRERSDELPAIIERLLHELGAPASARLAEGEVEQLAEHPWPGNFRELRNVLARSLVLHCVEALRPSQCLRSSLEPRPEPMSSPVPPPSGDEPAALRSLESLEDVVRSHCFAILRECGDNRTQAAAALGISVATLRRKLKDWSTTP